MSATTSDAAIADRPVGPRRLWDRQLQHYPETGPRYGYLALTVLCTVVLYYELYVQGSVATKIIQDLGFSWTGFVMVLVIGNAVGALASLAAGLADRYGRANIVVVGLFITGAIIAFGLPNAGSTAMYTILFAILSLVEGAALVATPALIRDFSPQVGRGVAMGFWTLGPVLGSLVVTTIATNTLDSQPDWQFQFYVCGAVGLVVAVIALFGLRELSPRLRDQLMVSLRDRALVEARAAGLDPEKALQGSWRQMLRLDILGPALAISLFLLLYYALVAFIVVYFATVFGFTEQRSNSIVNWYWATNAIALVAAGLLSDRFHVRKPFMLVGALISLVGVGLFAATSDDLGTSAGTFKLYFVIAALGGGLVYVAWMAAFTETVEKHNPAATATGLAVWGMTIRTVVTLSFASLLIVVPATSTLVDAGPRVQRIVAQYPQQVRTLQQVDPAVLAALQRNAGDQRAQVQALTQLTGLSAAEVTKAVTLGTRYATELKTAAAIPQATLLTLSAKPTDLKAQQVAVAAIATKLGVSPQQAAARLGALGRVPAADTVFLLRTGPQVQQSAARLAALSQVPPADLEYLADNAEDVAAAQKDAPGQWQTYWWIAFAGQLLFIPFIFVLTGHWSPRKARADEEAHERLVEQELAKLQSARTAPES
ncbi:MAG TPA: MFS transporter [Solirubrobacteraceae bacterium]|nr:MFS transporter [Solirubrobacteraceae bacterium]